ncbi:hypothetical protein DRN94_003930 [archaeon]|nr:hypothetical protein [archaeon]
MRPVRRRAQAVVEAHVLYIVSTIVFFVIVLLFVNWFFNRSNVGSTNQMLHLIASRVADVTSKVYSVGLQIDLPGHPTTPILVARQFFELPRSVGQSSYRVYYIVEGEVPVVVAQVGHSGDMIARYQMTKLAIAGADFTASFHGEIAGGFPRYSVSCYISYLSAAGTWVKNLTLVLETV